MIDFSGKTAVVSGAGAGIGRAIAEAFARLGAEVTGIEIDAARAEATGEAMRAAGLPVRMVTGDVRDAASVMAIFEDVEQRHGSLDILVNNVGDFLGVSQPFHETTEAEWDALYAVNLRHVFLATRAALPLLRKGRPGGSIINVSTIEAFRGIPMCPVYSAFKAGVTGFTKSLSLELAPEGIRVNAIAPETTETEQVKPSVYLHPEHQAHTPRWIPLGRFGTPEDMAGCAVFLASELSSWVTGTTIHADGGALAAGGFYRTPSGRWTNVPVVTGDGFGFT
jgi:NAD(P)-dependent dehydrogenase (short-subunit alcohol dehydrogenase family)